MRCLHCNKKLSLLKLAKGDSFCSPEHFDAYQLQLSKNAYERLISAPEEEAPKAPLVFKPVEVPQAELEADSALARLSAFRAPEKQAEPVAHAAVIQVPPYAPFLTEPLPSFPPNGPVPVASEPDSNEPVEAARAVAFPVHEVESTVCILNLYLRLSLSATPPLNWTPAWNAIATPEDFPGEITRPLLEVAPDFRHYENPEYENLAPVEPPSTVEAPRSIEPALHVKTSSLLEQKQPVDGADHRLPFLVAPSFRERAGEAIPFDTAASSAPHDWMLAPILDPVPVGGPHWSGKIPQSTGFAGNTSVRSRNADGQRIQSGFVLQAEMAPVLPEQSAIVFSGWQVSHGPMGIARPQLETSRVSTGAIDFAPPTPAPVRPDAKRTLNIDQRQILTAASTLGSLFRGVLETLPRGQEPAFVTPPLGATTFGLRSILAPFPAWESFSFRTWQNQAAHFSLPTTLADGVESPKFPPEPLRYAPDCIKQDAAGEQAPSLEHLPYLPMAWPGTDVTLPPSADPTPAAASPAIRFLTPRHIINQPAVIASALLGTVFERDFTLAPSARFGQPDLTSVASTSMPAADMPVRDSRIGLCALTATWNPCLPATPARSLAKFLPARKSPILPSARSWPRLGAPPQ
jgi:hypothetical protein